MALELFYPGLLGVCVGETTILEFGESPSCRGIPLKELFDQATISELVYTLWQGDWPNTEELADFESLLVDESELPRSIEDYLQQIPLHTPLIDLIRTSISMLSHHDDQYSDHTLMAECNKGLRILSRLPLILGYRQFHQNRKQNNPFIDSLPSFLNSILMDKPHQDHERIIELLLILHATREFETPAFTARIIASSMGDIYSSVLGGLGCLTGLNSFKCYQEWESIIHHIEIDGDEAVLPDLKKLLASDKPILGYVSETQNMQVHRQLIHSIYDEISLINADKCVLQVWKEFDQALWEAKKLTPSLDSMTLRIQYLMGMSMDQWQIIPLIGQIVNWIAHSLEQRDENIRFQPKLRYRGAHGLHILPNSSMELEDPFPFDKDEL